MESWMAISDRRNIGKWSFITFHGYRGRVHGLPSLRCSSSVVRSCVYGSRSESMVGELSCWRGGRKQCCHLYVCGIICTSCFGFGGVQFTCGGLKDICGGQLRLSAGGWWSWSAVVLLRRLRFVCVTKEQQYVLGSYRVYVFQVEEWCQFGIWGPKLLILRSTDHGWKHEVLVLSSRL